MLYPDQSKSITLLNRYQCLKIWRMLYHFLGMALDSICNNCHSSVITVTQPCIESRCLLYPISSNIIEGDLVGYLNTHCTSPAWPIADWRVTSTNLWQIWQLSGSGRSLFGSCQDVIQLALHFGWPTQALRHFHSLYVHLSIYVAKMVHGWWLHAISTTLITKINLKIPGGGDHGGTTVEPRQKMSVPRQTMCVPRRTTLPSAVRNSTGRHSVFFNFHVKHFIVTCDLCKNEWNSSHNIPLLFLQFHS